MACSAALTVFAPGAFITAMPRRVAACTSMLSTPVPARDHAQSLATGEQIRRHAGLAPHDERVRARERPLELLARLAGAVCDLDLPWLRQQLESCLRHLVGHRHAVGHATSTASRSRS